MFLVFGPWCAGKSTSFPFEATSCTSLSSNLVVRSAAAHASSVFHHGSKAAIAHCVYANCLSACPKKKHLHFEASGRCFQRDGSSQCALNGNQVDLFAQCAPCASFKWNGFGFINLIFAILFLSLRFTGLHVMD